MTTEQNGTAATTRPADDDGAAAGKPKRDPLLPTIIRSTAVTLDLSPAERQLVRATEDRVHARAAELSVPLLAMLGRDVRVYDPALPAANPFAARDAAYWDALLVTYTGPVTADQRELLRETAVGILKATNRKAYLYRLRQTQPIRELKEGHKPPKGSPLLTGMKSLSDAGVLPLRTLSACDPGLDLAAWGVATGALASWIEQDDGTRTNYAAESLALAKLAPDDDDAALFERWRAETGVADTDLTERLCARVRQYGFDVYHWEEEMAKARALCPDPDFWAKLFEWCWRSRRFAKLRPNATVRLPDARHSRRMVSFSPNHVAFRAKLDGERLVFTTRLWDGEKMVPATLTARPSGYFRDLRLTEVVSKSNYFVRLSYRRGNRSRHNEDVVGDLKVVRLMGVGDEYRAYLPLSYSQPQSALGAAARDRYYGEPAGPDGLPDGLRVFAADMGVNLFWAGRAVEVRDGVAHPLGTAEIGGVKDKAYHDRLNGLMADVWACKTLIDVRKAAHAGRGEPGRRTQDRSQKAFARLHRHGVTADGFAADTDAGRRTAVQRVIAAIKREYDHLKQFDVYPTRQRGVTQEMFTWLKLTKAMLSLLKKWTYYRRPPAQLGERRAGFEAQDRYFANLKSDAAKKIAQSLVAAARDFRADVIVVEDLDFGRKGMLDNEFLDIWAPATIQNLVEQFAVQYGIAVAAVNPAHTSRVDPQTGEWGYRPKFDRKTLWVMRGGKAVALNCDLDVASQNILNRFLDRAGRVFKLSAKAVAGAPGVFAPVMRDAVQNPKGKGWVRGELAHQLARAYGTEWVLIDNGAARPVTAAEFKAAKTTGKAVDLYRQRDRWVTPDERRAGVAAIQTVVEGVRPASGGTIKPATPVPKVVRSRRVTQKQAA